jgi:hypothetical protein
MGEQTGTRLNHRSAACKFPSESTREKQLLRPQGIKKSLNLNLKPGTTVAVGLIIILMASGVAIFWMLNVELHNWEQAMMTDMYWGGPVDLWAFASFMWFLVVTMLAGLIVVERVSMVRSPKLCNTSRRGENP